MVGPATAKLHLPTVNGMVAPVTGGPVVTGSHILWCVLNHLSEAEVISCSAGQSEKLRCILNYFERIALDPGGPSGSVTFRRQVMFIITSISRAPFPISP